MEPKVLGELACHIVVWQHKTFASAAIRNGLWETQAQRMQDPEFQDSIRQIVDKASLRDSAGSI